MALSRLRLPAAVAVTAAVLATCGKDPSAPQPPTVATISLAGLTTLRVGAYSQLVARTFDAQGQELFGRSITWSSSDSSVATVSATGLVYAVTVGQAVITTVAEGRQANATITISPLPVMRVVVTPGIDSLLVGDSMQLSALLLDSAGNATSRPLVWGVSDTAKARVSQGGVVVARRPESFAVTATSEGIVGGSFLLGQYPVASLTLPDTVTTTLRLRDILVADLRSAVGTPIGNRAITWSSFDTLVATVDATGLVKPQAIGTAAIRAASGGVADTTLLIVLPEPLGAVFLVDVALGAQADTLVADRSDTAFLLADVRDRTGLAAPWAAVAWSSADTTIAQVTPDSSGSSAATVTAVAVGTTRIIATAGPVADTINVRVRYPIARLKVVPESLSLNVGSLDPVYYALRDTFDVVVAYPQNGLALTISDSSVAAPSCCYYVVATAPGRTNFVWSAAHNGVVFSDTTVVVVPSPSTMRLFWTVAPVTIREFDFFRATVYVADVNGVPYPGGKDLTITSSDTSIVSVSPGFLPGAGGNVDTWLTARRPGTASIAVASDSQFDVLPVEVTPVPARSLQISPRPIIQRVGDSITMTTAVYGTDNQQHPYPVTWSSTDSAVAVPNDSGLLMAVGAGRAWIRARSGSAGDSLRLTIQSVNAPTIDSVRPGPLVPGQPATIHGANFDADPANDTVLIDGVAVNVVAASPQQLDVMVPAATSWPCRPTHSALVTVAAAERFAAAQAPLATARQHALAPGEAVVFANPGESTCNEFAVSGGLYAVAIVNPAPDPLTQVSFELRGADSTGVPPIAVVAEAPSPTLSEPRVPLGKAEAIFPDGQAARQTHARLLEQSRQLSRRAGPPAPLLRAMPRMMQSVADSVGPLARFHIPRIEAPDFCEQYTAITARRAAVGVHVVIYEDIASNLAGTLDAYYRTLRDDFDTKMFPLLKTHFGDPLALDSLLDGNGKIVMLFSPRINQYGVGGFVVSCDFYPETVAPSSNLGEVFYAVMPTSANPQFGPGTVPYWWWLIRTIVMHESKHLTAFAERLSRGLPIEDGWLEEGSAVLGEELWARNNWGWSWKGNLTYPLTLYCEVRPISPGCGGRPYSMFNAWAFLHDYARNVAGRPGNELHSPLGPTSGFDATFYGGAWSLLRWSVDQYANTEIEFLRAMTISPTVSGVANLEARTGRPLAELIADWSLALLIDDQIVFTPARPQHNSLSWNTPNIFAGMSQDFPSDFVAFPLVPRQVGFGNFLVPVTGLPGGTASLFYLQGFSSPPSQLLELRGPGGSPPPPALRIEVLRIQ